MYVFYSDKFLLHSFGGGYPECPERLLTIKRELEKDPTIKFKESSDVTEEEIYLICKKEYIKSLKDLSKKGAIFPDNVFSKNTFEIAKLAAAASRDAALSCNDEFSFALVRPPGHHAGSNYFAGFCYINNIAFAVKSIQKLKNIKKIMIIDFDYHFGNGTWDIFYKDQSIFYLSFHCDPTIAYPGRGFENENTDSMVNVVIDRNISDNEYIHQFEKKVKDYSKKFKPEVIAISAGFDSYFKDPIAGFQIKDIKTYRIIGEVIASLKKPSFAVLEGGYYLPKLGEMVKNFITPFIRER